MSRADASPAYRAALRQQGLGQVWRSEDQETSDYAFAFHTFSGAPYNEALPKRRRNDRGQDFTTEFQFLAGDEIPNAFAFCGSGDGLFVGMTASMFGLVNRACERLFADGAISDLLHEPHDVAVSRERWPTVRMMDMSQKAPFILDDFQLDDAIISAKPPADWRSHYKRGGDFLFATSDQYRIRDAVLSYLFHHEMGHLVEGHVGLLSQRRGAGAGAVRESDFDPRQTDQRQAMEFQADIAASKMTALISHSRHSVGRHIGLAGDWNHAVTLDVLAIYLAQTILTMTTVFSAFFQNFLERGEVDFQDGEVKAIFERNAAYPSAGVRTLSARNTYVNALEPMDVLIEDDVVLPDETRHLRTGNILLYLLERYAEFALVVGATTAREDRFLEERKAIFYGEAMKTLARDCAPFSFGGV